MAGVPKYDYTKDLPKDLPQDQACLDIRNKNPFPKAPYAKLAPELLRCFGLDKQASSAQSAASSPKKCGLEVVEVPRSGDGYSVSGTLPPGTVMNNQSMDPKKKWVCR